jgi:hypothetical protein
VGLPDFPASPGFVPFGFKERVGFFIWGSLSAITEGSAEGGS